MDYEAKYGKQILKCTATEGQVLKRRLLFLIPAILFLAFGISLVVRPEIMYGEDIGGMLIPLCFGGGVLLLAMSFIFVRKGTAVLYEGGFVLASGAKVKETDFNDVKGILDTKYADKVYGIPAGNTRIVMIYKRDGKGFHVTKAAIPNYDQFCDELSVAISVFLLKGITKDNIADARISFGDKLELAEGQLVHNAGKNGMISIPLDAVREISYFGDGYWLDILGDVDETGKPERLARIRADLAQNLDSLNSILAMFA